MPQNGRSRQNRRSRRFVSRRRPLRRRAGVSAWHSSAQRRLKRFRQGSLLAVAVTGLFLLLWGVPADVPAQDSVAPADTTALDSVLYDDVDPVRSVEEATGTVRQLLRQFTDIAPKLIIAFGLIIIAAVLVRMIRALLRIVLKRWEKADAVTAMSGVVIWLLAIGVALTVIAGDARALVGSVGLLGLALSWALQAPIESFAGWLLNSFKGYYRVGDRIAVGDVFGDVYDIDVLNTTVWEAGGPDKPVQGAQPTGALITFPNSEVLRANVVNYTRRFPYVWDEITIGVANESDVGYAMRVIGDVARGVVGDYMKGPVRTYRGLLESEGLSYDVAEEPQLYLSPTESWTDITVRYLVGARERRKWASALLLEIHDELAKPEHAQHVKPAYPVRRIFTVDDVT